MSPKEKLKTFMELLSDDECKHLLSVVQDVMDGERFWEGDIGHLYNEYVKARYFNLSRNLSNIVPAGPSEGNGMFVPVPIVKSYPDAGRIALPSANENLAISLTDALRCRRSRREYTGGDISKQQLSALLQHACGTNGSVTGYDYTHLPLRTFPSSGGLQSPEVYLSIQAVEELSPGLYHYNPLTHTIELLKPGNQGSSLRNVGLGQPYIETSAVVMLITGYYERLRWKYGERAYRYMCMDLGFLAQNVHLVGEALGLGVCAIAGFVDDAIEDLLAINGKDEMILLLMTIGVRGNEPTELV
jgi:SagB-type dehydrogenase family enzyme